MAGSGLSATWQLADNSTTHPNVDGSLRGQLGDQAVDLQGTFRLDDDYIFEHGEVTGTVGDDPVHARIEALDGGRPDTGTVGVDGVFAGTTVALVATISGNLTGGLLAGTVGDQAIRLDTATERRPERKLR